MDVYTNGVGHSRPPRCFEKCTLNIFPCFQIYIWVKKKKIVCPQAHKKVVKHHQIHLHSITFYNF
jgi:hypothetical protein